MAIDVGRGIKRLLLVICLFWFGIFFALSSMQLNQENFSQIESSKPCEEVSTGIFGIDIEKLKEKGLVDLRTNNKGQCEGFYKIPFYDRYSAHSTVLLMIGLAAIPFYMLISYVINGFYIKRND